MEEYTERLLNFKETEMINTEIIEIVHKTIEFIRSFESFLN